MTIRLFLSPLGPGDCLWHWWQCNNGWSFKSICRLLIIAGRRELIALCHLKIIKAAANKRVQHQCSLPVGDWFLFHPLRRGRHPHSASTAIPPQNASHTDSLIRGPKRCLIKSIAKFMNSPGGVARHGNVSGHGAADAAAASCRHKYRYVEKENATVNSPRWERGIGTGGGVQPSSGGGRAGAGQEESSRWHNVGWVFMDAVHWQ